MQEQHAAHLSYATPEPRVRTAGWSCIALFAFCAALPVPLMLIGPRMPHDWICPSCGGWGAGILIALMAILLVTAIATLVRATRARARIASLALAAMACALATFYLAAAIALYFAIQA